MAVEEVCGSLVRERANHGEMLTHIDKSCKSRSRDMGCAGESLPVRRRARLSAPAVVVKNSFFEGPESHAAQLA